jgi:hypothetical protein
MKFLQESIIVFFIVKMLYSIVISLLSLQFNDILTTKSPFMISLLFSLIFLIAYSIYFFVWVKNQRHLELYKINNIFRAVSLVIVVVNKFAGIILLDLVEIIFIILDLMFYRD